MPPTNNLLAFYKARVAVTDTGMLGTGSISLGASTLLFSQDSMNFSNPLDIVSASTPAFAGGLSTFGGDLSGQGALTINPASNGVLTLLGDSSGCSGSTTVSNGTVPTNALSCFRITSVSKGSPVRVWFPSVTNRLYTLYTASSLTGNGGWTNVPGQTDIAGNDGVGTLTDTNAAPSKFYRVGVAAALSPANAPRKRRPVQSQSTGLRLEAAGTRGLGPSGLIHECGDIGVRTGWSPRSLEFL